MPTNEFITDTPDLPAQGPEVAPLPTDYLFFVLRAGRRRMGLTLSVFLASIAALIGYYAWKTPLYRAEAQVLAQRQQSLPSIIRSNVNEDQPTRAAWEIIHRRDNLRDLVRQAGLLDSPAVSLKLEALDPLRSASSRTTDELPPGGDLLDLLVDVLDRRLKVETGDVTISIEIDWPNPQQAYRLVDGALQNFLEARHVQEVTAMDETISLLQGRAAVLRDELTRTVDETRRAVLRDSSRVVPGSSAPAPPSEDLVRLKSMLDAKERAISDVEEFRRRRLADLQAQYDTRRATYSEMHPELITLRQDIAALTRDSTQVTTLREEERKLRQDYQARLAQEPAARPLAHDGSVAVPRAPEEGVNAAVEQSERVREARTRYQQLIQSVNSAQLELDTARAAFKHRYKVIRPPQVPKKPFSPNPLKIFGVGGMASLLLALLVAAFTDYRSGRILERWQVERDLGLPVIAETSDG